MQLLNFCLTIIEDEKPAARRLQRMLEKLGFQKIVLLHSVKESVGYFKENPAPDLLFLDVQLSDGLSFEIFDQVSVNSAVIFTTAYDRYALRAFELNSVDYLLKPIAEKGLKNAVEKFQQNWTPSDRLGNSTIEQLKKALVKTDNYKFRFRVKVGEHHKIFKIENIECLFSQNKGTYLNTDQGRHYLLDESLNQIEPQLDPKQFFRINRQLIVNIDFIQDIVSYSNSRLKVNLQFFKNPKDLVVSRERVSEFKKWLG